jgi:hypothetical protein
MPQVAELLEKRVQLFLVIHHRDSGQRRLAVLERPDFVSGVEILTLTGTCLWYRYYHDSSG